MPRGFSIFILKILISHKYIFFSFLINYTDENDTSLPICYLLLREKKTKEKKIFVF